MAKDHFVAVQTAHSINNRRRSLFSRLRNTSITASLRALREDVDEAVSATSDKRVILRQVDHRVYFVTLCSSTCCLDFRERVVVKIVRRGIGRALTLLRFGEGPKLDCAVGACREQMLLRL